MTEFALALAVLAIAGAVVGFFLVGFITGYASTYKRYVAMLAALLVVYLGTMVALKGPIELFTNCAMVAWLAGIAAGEIYGRIKARRKRP